MDWRNAARICAILAPASFLLLTSAAVLNFPGYNPEVNYLSDLGNGKFASAVFFNIGCIISGAFAVLLAAGLYKVFGRKSTAIIGLAGIFLILVGAFPEGHELHTPVSVTFFVLAGLGAIAFGIEMRNRIARYSSIFGILMLAIFVLGITPLAEHIAVALIMAWSLFVFSLLQRI